MKNSKIWVKIQGDPDFMKKTNGWLTIFWIANFPPVIALYLMVDNETFQTFCLLYLALVSIWANVAGHLSAWQAGRVELEQVTGSTLNDEDRQWLMNLIEKNRCSCHEAETR